MRHVPSRVQGVVPAAPVLASVAICGFTFTPPRTKVQGRTVRVRAKAHGSITSHRQRQGEWPWVALRVPRTWARRCCASCLAC
ncbi:protein of unknown function [Cupriavidus taiwanensis]|uniref:Uncharacterized protein n=1 Tax=Cupriavidus taiwanensis TaxID=164546 RepID=A0A9Q7XRH7_9BURK|nr:protein of unknown function [Cupriavidus taiwanensis]